LFEGGGGNDSIGDEHLGGDNLGGGGGEGDRDL